MGFSEQHKSKITHNERNVPNYVATFRWIWGSHGGHSVYDYVVTPCTYERSRGFGRTCRLHFYAERVSHAAYFWWLLAWLTLSTPKMEAVYSSEMSRCLRTTRRYNLDEGIPHQLLLFLTAHQKKHFLYLPLSSVMFSLAEHGIVSWTHLCLIFDVKQGQ